VENLQDKTQQILDGHEKETVISCIAVTTDCKFIASGAGTPNAKGYAPIIVWKQNKEGKF
jgi:hypothetical protein